MAMNKLSDLLGLVSRNVAIHTLRLDNMPASEDPAAMFDYSVRLFSALKMQTQLEEFSFSGVTEECQELLGDFLGKSVSIKSLSIRLQPVAAMPGLIAGLGRNTSLETLVLDIGAIAPDIEPMENSLHLLIEALGKNKSSVERLQLDLCRCPANTFSALFSARGEGGNNRVFIADLLASISRLSMLSLHVPNGACLDLLPIADGLENNHSLEHLDISFERSAPGKPDLNGRFDLHTFPAFVKKLAQSRTLVKLTAQNAGSHDTLFHSSAELCSVLERNANFQKYACSRAYIDGAASGFFETLDLPPDPAVLLGKHIEAQRPHIFARALALVNTVGNKRALEARRAENAVDLKASLKVVDGGPYPALSEMCELFRNIAVTKQDFSDADLKRIASSDALSTILVEWMDKNRSQYIYLAQRFAAAIGSTLLREKFKTAFPSPSDLTSHRLAMLEQTFQPDQTHLTHLMDKELDYQSIDSVELKFFVGYNVVVADGYRPHLLMDDVTAWCIDHGCPELYLAYVGNFPKTVVETQTMPDEFRRRFLSRIPATQTIKRLLLMNVDPKDDADVLAPLLSNGSGLHYLHLHNLYCSREYFDVLMDKISENTELRRLKVYLPQSQRSFPLIEKIIDMLGKNRALGMLTLKVPIEHPESPLLRRLMHSNGRFELKTGYFGYISQSSDDDSDDSQQV